jgi:nucleotide-binding universal stress UspA family protein
MAHQYAILVPVTGSSASLDAVSVACGIAKQKRGRVLAVHVIEVLRSLPLNAELDSEARRGEQVLRRAEEVAAHGGIHLIAQLLQARDAGQAIVDEARDREIDAIVMGIGYKRLIGTFQVGRTADFVLKNASCQVWVVRQAVGPAHDHEHE